MDGFHGLTVLDHRVFRGTGGIAGSAGVLELLDLSGGATENFEYDSTGEYELHALSEANLLLVPGLQTFRRFEASTLAFRADFPNTGRVYSMRRFGDEIFASTVGSQWVPEANATQSACYIARIPIADVIKSDRR